MGPIEFVPYNLSVKLKELGFNEPCFGFYQKEYVETIPTMVDDDEQYRLTGYRTCKNSEIPEHYISAPTFSQAFRWFRENKLADGSVCRHGKADGSYSYRWDIVYEYGVYEERHFKQDYKTHEEAELVCLEKLIEITKK
jgi:hypothetical protein